MGGRGGHGGEGGGTRLAGWNWGVLGMLDV